jgi:hypothetical protein
LSARSTDYDASEEVSYADPDKIRRQTPREAATQGRSRVYGVAGTRSSGVLDGDEMKIPYLVRIGPFLVDTARHLE